MNIKELIFIIANGGQVRRVRGRDGKIGYESEAMRKALLPYTVPANIVNAAMRHDLIDFADGEAVATQKGMQAYSPGDCPEVIKKLGRWTRK